jgi:large subunit ribosomal protein L23
MGLINNWLHKKEKDQLKDASEKKTPKVLVAKEKTAKTKVVAKHVGHDHDEVREVKAKKEKEVVPVKSKLKLSNHSTAYKVLVKPLVTEKSAIAESKNKYSFIVSLSANKNQVKEAIAEVYGVKPVKVNIINTDGRPMRFGRSMGRRSDYKKAIVTLPAGSTIDIHAGV